MLFFTKNGFLEVLSEPQFENVFTLQATDAGDLIPFTSHTPATVMFTPRSDYKYVLYVRKEKVAEILEFIPVLFETDRAQLPLSARVPLYLIEGLDPFEGKAVKLLVEAIELKGMQSKIESLVDVAMYPIFKSPDAIMDEGGLW